MGTLYVRGGSGSWYQITEEKAGVLKVEKTDGSPANLKATNGIITKVDVGDYGGGFANYSPSPSEEGVVILAIDTNSTSPGARIYVYANGKWYYTELTEVA